MTISKTARSPCWYLQYSQGGKQIRTSSKTTSKKRALEKARKIDAQLGLGQAELPSGRPTTLSDAKEQYLRALSLKDRSPKTVMSYRSKLDAFQIFSEKQGIRTLESVTANVLENYQQQLKKTGVAPTTPKPKGTRGPHFKAEPNKPGTIRNKLKIVRQLLKWAEKRGMVPANPAKGYDLPPAPKQQAYCWKDSELQLILDHAPAQAQSLSRYEDDMETKARSGAHRPPVCSGDRDRNASRSSLPGSVFLFCARYYRNTDWSVAATAHLEDAQIGHERRRGGPGNHPHVPPCFLQFLGQ